MAITTTEAKAINAVWLDAGAVCVDGSWVPIRAMAAAVVGGPASDTAARCRHQLAIGGTWRQVDAAARSTLGSSMHDMRWAGAILGSSLG